MSFDRDDPRLTAYVLGELEPAERAELEAALETSPELRQAVAQLRETAGLVQAALASEPLGAAVFSGGTADPASYLSATAGLSSSAWDTGRQAISGNHPLSSDEPVVPTKQSKLRVRRSLLVSLTLAASLLVAVGFYANRRFARQVVPLYARSISAVERRQAAVQQSGRERYRQAITGLKRQNEAKETSFDARRRRQIGVVDTLSAIEKSHIVTPDEPALNYPDAATWQQLTEHRKKMDAKSGSGAEAKQLTPRYETKTKIMAYTVAPRVDGAQAANSLGYGSNAKRPAGQPVGDVGGAGLQAPNVFSEDLDIPFSVNGQVDGHTDLSARLPGQQYGLQRGYDKDHEHNTEAYARINDNPFLAALDNPLSTFSIDVDTASYANVRRFLTQGALPPPDAVRIEELVNYFSYHYAPPEGDVPFAVHTEMTACPWSAGHRLLRIGLKGREIAAEARPASSLVFLLDVSGSMDQPNKLPLVKQAMRLLVERLGENDRVAIVVYAGASGLALPSTTANNHDTILAAIEQLSPGGSTNGAQGIELAYETATANFVKGGVNRVILATDGDFNVGVTNEGDLTRLIEDKAKSGVYLSVLGFGMGNLKDATLEKLADKGNGNYGYVDTANEARKLFVDQLSGTLVTIAKDVKIQIEFNPARVAAYRLLGYENRMLAAEDFNDDTKDAGEIGAGHTVTALYEIVPAGAQAAEATAREADALKYQRPAALAEAAAGGELLTLKLRYKSPDQAQGDEAASKLLEFTASDPGKGIGEASEDTRFAAAVALFGMLLRHSPHAGNGTPDAVLEMAASSLGDDPHGYRAEFVDLVRKAKEISSK